MATQYVVKKGDTLSGIAKQHGVSQNQVTGYKSGNPNLIYPGEVLTIGGGGGAPASSSQPAQTSGAFSKGAIGTGGPATGPLTSSDVGGTPSQSSASFEGNGKSQPQAQPQPQPSQQYVQQSQPSIQPSTSAPTTTPPPASTLISPQTGQLASRPSPYKIGAEQAISDGITEIKDGGDAIGVVDSYVPSTGGRKPESTPNVDSFFLSNPFFQQTNEQLMEFLNPQSIRDTFKTYLDQLAADREELAGLKLEFMNNKRLMEGTTDQIRDEITKSGGFGTESQIQGLSIVRNKALIQRSNQLTDLIQAQQDAINNDISLLDFEKDLANQQFQQRSFLLNYQQENAKFMFNAARDTYNTLIDKNPQGLYDALLANPQEAQRFTSITGIGIDALRNIANIVKAPETKEVGGNLYQWDSFSQTWKLAIKGLDKGLDIKAPETREIGGNLYQWDPVSKGWRLTISGPSGAGGLTPSQLQSALDKISDNYRQDSVVKQYTQALPGYEFLKSINPNTTNPADDIGLIYAFAKIMDPESVVREGEYNTVQKYANSWAQTFGFNATRIFSNTKFLSSEAVKNMQATARARFDALKSAQERAKTIYQQQIDDLKAGKTGVGGLPQYEITSDPMKDLQDDINQAISSGDYGNKYKTREMLLEALISLYPEFTLDEIAKQVYTLIPDIK